MLDIRIKWEHLTEESKKNIIDEFINELDMQDLTDLLENIEYNEENAINQGTYSEFNSYDENEFTFKKNQMYSTLEHFLSQHFPFTVSI
ncbi:MAG: hypothetical protein ABFR75_08610 [Acidobacteriota bacterium]